MPAMFTAPASFLAFPEEGVFKQIKLVDFRERKLPLDFKATGAKIGILSKKEDLLAQISCYILTMSIDTIKQIFYERLSKL